MLPDIETADDAREWQRYVNNHQIWRFEGAIGRAAMGAITNGFLMFPKVPGKDYWGNPIPSRTQVIIGSPGSRSFVAEMRGEEWAATLEEVP